jgi:DNA repair protein RecO (recombination protein O)
VLELMSALHDGDWEAAQEAPQSTRNHVSGLVAAHLQWHLERQLKTLPLVERTYQAYQVDRPPQAGGTPTVADRRAALIRQDMACG